MASPPTLAHGTRPSVTLGARNHRVNKKSSLSPDEYVEQVRAHAKRPRQRTLYPGEVYEDLWLFLKDDNISPRSTLAHNHELLPVIKHGVLHNFNGTCDPEVQYLVDPKDCAHRLRSESDPSSRQVLFLRGHSSPEWLREVAAACDIDPAFLISNLLFRCRRAYYSFPALPSSYENIIRLRFMTIGSKDTRRTEPDADVVEKLRTKARDSMESYRHRLQTSNLIRLSDSIVRGYYILDERHFVLEQEIAIFLDTREQNNKAWTIVVCSDIGNNLAEGVDGPWLHDHDPADAHTFLLPTIQHQERVAFKSRTIEGSEPSLAHSKFAQTASVLPHDYGRLLDKGAMISDPFYCLDEIFRLCASSENQFLGLIERTIERDTDHESLKREKPSLSNLLYCQGLLGDHIGHLKYLSDIIRKRGSSTWPHAQDKDGRAESDSAAEALIIDHEHLLHRAEQLYQRCDKGMAIMMNNVMLAESRQTMNQAKRVTKLTFIAFLYIPLSFTTSLFGMNVIELVADMNTPHIWVWAVVSFPVLLITMLLFFIDAQLLARVRRKIRSAVGTPESRPENLEATRAKRLDD